MTFALPTSFAFVLDIEDYVAMSAHSCVGTSSYYRASAGRAALWGLCALLVADRIREGQFPRALFVGLCVAVAVFVGLPIWWRRRYRRSLRPYYSQPSQQLLLGPHTLTLSPEGLESVGPNHRAFRTWRTVTHVCSTEAHILLSTVFGNVYILPKRALGAPEEVLASLRQLLPDVEFRPQSANRSGHGGAA